MGIEILRCNFFPLCFLSLNQLLRMSFCLVAFNHAQKSPTNSPPPKKNPKTNQQTLQNKTNEQQQQNLFLQTVCGTSLFLLQNGLFGWTAFLQLLETLSVSLMLGSVLLQPQSRLYIASQAFSPAEMSISIASRLSVLWILPSSQAQDVTS